MKEYRMRSVRGVLGVCALLLALPATIVYQILFGDDAGVVVHVCLAIGAALVSWAAFDFQSPRWMAWLGSVSTAGLAVIFALQAAAPLVASEILNVLAYQVLAVVPEGLFQVSATVWLLALTLTISHGYMKILGSVTAAASMCALIYTYGLLFSGSPWADVPQSLRLVYLLPFVWLLLESRAHPSRVSVSPNRAPATA
jgi:hypothetical protein